MFWWPVALKRVSSSRCKDFPNGVAVGFDDHAAFDDFGGLRHVPLKNDVLIPGGEVGRARSDRGFSHVSVLYGKMLRPILLNLSRESAEPWCFPRNDILFASALHSFSRER